MSPRRSVTELLGDGFHHGGAYLESRLEVQAGQAQEHADIIVFRSFVGVGPRAHAPLFTTVEGGVQVLEEERDARSDAPPSCHLSSARDAAEGKEHTGLHTHAAPPRLRRETPVSTPILVTDH